MSGLLIGSIIFIVICAIIVLIGAAADSPDMIAGGLVTGFLVGLFLFGAIIPLTGVRDESQAMPACSIAKSADTVFVKTPTGETIETNAHNIYVADTNDLKIVETISYNSYGLECGIRRYSIVVQTKQPLEK